MIAEAAAAFAIRRLGYRVVLAAGALLLGAPTLALLPREPLAIMVAVSLVRGLGFGLCGVAAGALTALLLPPERRGEGLGLLGLVSGVPAIVALPAGVWLAGHHQATAVVAVAAIMGLLPLAALRWLPGGRPGSRPGDGPAAGGGGAFRLALVFAVCTVAAGRGRLVPAARRGGAERHRLGRAAGPGDHRHHQPLAGRPPRRPLGHARLLVPAVIAAALGMAAMIWLASPAAVLAGHGAVRGRLRRGRELDVRAADRAAARGPGERALEPRLRRRVRRRPGRCSACSAPKPATPPGSP